MSLSKCPDCGHDVSSGARACPHCGRPFRRTSSPVELSGVLIIAVIGAGVLLWRLSSRSEPPVEGAPVRSPETISAEPTREGPGLGAVIGYNRKLSVLRVENRDSFPWSGCQLSLNAQGVSSGYTLEVDTIRPGLTEAALLQSAEFTDADGSKFDPASHPVATLDVACETPRGRLSYGGRFPPQEAPGG
jgi:zinc ribbon protein